jgi:hypothetical protein
MANVMNDQKKDVVASIEGSIEKENMQYESERAKWEVSRCKTFRIRLPFQASSQNENRSLHANCHIVSPKMQKPWLPKNKAEKSKKQNGGIELCHVLPLNAMRDPTPS